MATTRSVITGALRKLAIVGGVGRREPSDLEFSDSLKVLVAAYRGLITSGAFGRLREVLPQDDYVAGENQRVFRTVNEQQQIELPDLVSGCGTCGYKKCEGDIDVVSSTYSNDYGRGFKSKSSGLRPVRDGSVVVLIDNFSGDMLEAMYDGSTKRWITLTELDTNEDLDEEDEWSVKRLNDALALSAPLSHRDYNGLVAYLAMLLADEFGAELTPLIMEQARQFKINLVQNYSFYKPED